EALRLALSRPAAHDPGTCPGGGASRCEGHRGVASCSEGQRVLVLRQAVGAAPSQAPDRGNGARGRGEGGGGGLSRVGIGTKRAESDETGRSGSLPACKRTGERTGGAAGLVWRQSRRGNRPCQGTCPC